MTARLLRGRDKLVGGPDYEPLALVAVIVLYNNYILDAASTCLGVT